MAWCWRWAALLIAHICRNVPSARPPSGSCQASQPRVMAASRKSTALLVLAGRSRWRIENVAVTTAHHSRASSRRVGDHVSAAYAARERRHRRWRLSPSRNRTDDFWRASPVRKYGQRLHNTSSAKMFICLRHRVDAATLLREIISAASSKSSAAGNRKRPLLGESTRRFLACLEGDNFSAAVPPTARIGGH